jgi:hypothetical protein
LYLIAGSGLPSFLLGNGSVYSWSTANAAPAAGSWSHIAVTMSGATATHYLNGLSNGSGTVSTTIADGGRNAKIGSRDDLFTMFKGALDEIRVSNSARSADWIATEYNNQYAPATFYTLAPEGAYTYNRPITINHNMVPNTTQANFPFLFNTTDAMLRNATAGGHVNSTNGYDIALGSNCQH